MDLFSRFKKDYFNYLVSIIIPAVISGLSIPLFKFLLGAKGYGRFSLWLNAALIISVVLYGWITQSILRFYHTSLDKEMFSKGAILLSIRTQLVFFLPVFIIVLIISHDLFTAFLFGLLLMIVSLQFTVLNIIQSSFLSKKIIRSEAIRMVSYIILAVMLLKITALPYLYSLLIAVMVSYLLSVLFLFKQTRIPLNFPPNNQEGQLGLFSKFFKYGAPLSLWFVFASLLPYIDKLFILKNFGAEIQGNYQAIFDLISKSLILLVSPIVTSVYPILSSAYREGDNSKIRALLKKVILYEIVALVLICMGYWAFGAHLVSIVLKTPDTRVFREMGFIVILGTIVWQIAILVQKRFELKMKSFVLLKMVIIAFATQLGFYLIFQNSGNQLIYPLGFLLSAMVYLFLVSITEVLPKEKYKKMVEKFKPAIIKGSKK